MTEDRDALIQHYQRMRRDLLVAIEGLSDEQLSERSLGGWSVKDHLAHLVLWDEVRVAEVLRISAGHESAWRLTEAQVDTFNALGHVLRRDLSPEQVRWELASSMARLLEALASATPRGLDGSRYGEASLRSLHEDEHTGWIRDWRREKGI